MIGVFDSGIGGLTVLSSIHRLMPATPLIYLADQANAPYGNLSDRTLLDRCRLITQWLEAQGCSLIVIACNTATALAIDTLRQEFSIPIVGVEPGVKPAALTSQSKCIGILATENTVASERYKKLLERFMPTVSIVSQGCLGLADAIEQGAAEITPLLLRYSEPLILAGADQIVLGCTHYPLVKNDLQHIVGPAVKLIDTSGAVALEVQRRYGNTIQPALAHESLLTIYSTGNTKALNRTIEAYPELGWLSGHTIEHCELSRLETQP